jgi:hypothetical protein
MRFSIGHKLWCAAVGYGVTSARQNQVYFEYQMREAVTLHDKAMSPVLFYVWDSTVTPENFRKLYM